MQTDLEPSCNATTAELQHQEAATKKAAIFSLLAYFQQCQNRRY
jgi:hypothetical protein